MPFRWLADGSPATHARLFEDKVFGWKEWDQHRNAAWRHRFEPVICLRVAAGFVWQLVLVLFTSVLTGLYEWLIVPLGMPGISLQFAATPFGMTTFALALLLVFKTNSSFARWWEGRIVWGQVVNFGRNFPRILLAYCVSEPASGPRVTSDHLHTQSTDGSARGEAHESHGPHWLPRMGRHSLTSGAAVPSSGPVFTSEQRPTYSAGGSARSGVHGLEPPRFVRHSLASRTADMQSCSSALPVGEHETHADAMHGPHGLGLPRTDEVHGHGLPHLDAPHKLHGDEAPHVGVLRALLRWTAAAPHVLRGHLREATASIAEGEAAHLLFPDELEYLRQHWTNKPQGVAFVLSHLCSHGLSHLQPFQQYHLQEQLSLFVNMAGACERIQKSPIPPAYARHTSRFLLIYVALSPVLLWPAVGWGTLIVAPLVAFLLIGIENVGVQIEEPFRVLPLDAICKGYEAGVGEMACSGLPPPPPDVQWPTVWRLLRPQCGSGTDALVQMLHEGMHGVSATPVAVVPMQRVTVEASKFESLDMSLKSGSHSSHAVAHHITSLPPVSGHAVDCESRLQAFLPSQN